MEFAVLVDSLLAMAGMEVFLERELVQNTDGNICNFINEWEFDWHNTMKAWSRVVRGSDYNCGEMGSSPPSINKVSSVSGYNFQHKTFHNIIIKTALEE